MQYISLVASLTDKAEKLWNIKHGEIKSQQIINTIGKEKTGHPAPFPEALAHDQISTWSNEQDLIYDCFMGSGTAAKVCTQSNRNYIGSEIAEQYCKIAQNRIQTSQGLFNVNT